MHAYSWVTIAIAFRVISGRSLGMMTVSNRRYLQTSLYGVNGSDRNLTYGTLLDVLW